MERLSVSKGLERDLSKRTGTRGCLQANSPKEVGWEGEEGVSLNFQWGISPILKLRAYGASGQNVEKAAPRSESPVSISHETNCFFSEESRSSFLQEPEQREISFVE